MQETKNIGNKRLVALAVAGLFVLTGFAFLSPGTAVHTPNDYTFDLNEFDAKGPTGNWVVDPSGLEVTQTAAGGRVSFFASDSANLLNDGTYLNVLYGAEIDAPSTNNNIFGFAFGLTRPTGTGTLVEAYILDWKGEEQLGFGHTAPEGFTLYRIDGNVPNTDAAAFACYWGKDPADCATATGGAAQLEVIDSHTGLGTGWDHGENYHIVIRHEADTIRVFVAGGAYGGGQVVIDAAGDFSELGMFALYNFRQEDVTYSNVGLRDETGPSVDIEVDCEDGTLILNPAWVAAEAACGGDPDTLMRLRSSASDDGSGFASMECYLDGSLIGTDEFECSIWQTLQHSGDYEYRVVAEDNFGNVNDVTLLYQLDKIPYDVEIEFTCGGVEYHAPDGSFKACDVPATVEGLAHHVFGSPEDARTCTVSGPPADTCAAQLLTWHGAFDYELETVDVLGNFNSISDQFLIELIDPELPVPDCDIPSQPGYYPPAGNPGWCRSSITLPAPSALTGIQSEVCELLDATDPNAVWTAIDCWEDEAEGLRAQLPDGMWSYRATVTSNVDRVTTIGFDPNNPIEFMLDSQKPEGVLVSPVPETSYIDGLEVPCVEHGFSFGIGTPSNSLIPGQQVTLTPPEACVARGEIEVVIDAFDPLKDDFASGLDRIEIWDGVRGVSGDAGGLWHIDTLEANGADGVYTYTWDTSEAPSPSEPHVLQTRVLQVRLFDTANNFEKLEFEIFVLP